MERYYVSAFNPAMITKQLHILDSHITDGLLVVKYLASFLVGLCIDFIVICTLNHFFFLILFCIALCWVFHLV